jgi:hypothetical protein
MKTTAIAFLRYLFTVSTVLLFVPVFGQHKLLAGLIVDGSTGDPIPAVSIKFIGSTAGGTLSKQDGTYTIRYNSTIYSLQFSAVGHKTKTIHTDSLLAVNGLVSLEREANSLDEVIITSTGNRSRYRNKNNPAVEFIKQVIAHLDDNMAGKDSDFAYIEYEKLSMSLSMENEKVPGARLLKKYPFLRKGLDSMKRKGRSLVPVYLQERSTRIVNHDRQQDSTLLGYNQSRIDLYLDEDGFDAYLDKLYGRPDLYAHDITLGNRRFLSPVSPLGPTFYKYHIVDTIKSTQPWQLELSIYPRNRQDALFSGSLFVSLDDHYALQRAELYVNDEAGINWVDDLHVTLSYKQNGKGKYFLNKSEMSLHLGIFEKGIGVFGEKTFFIPDQLDAAAGAAYDTLLKQPSAQKDWSRLRPEPLSKLDQSAFANIDSLKHSASFRRSMALGAFLLSGYVGRGPVEIGPVNSFYSYNPVEGSRVRFGGRTTDAFSKRLFFDAYGAYGTRDKIIKYGLTATVSLTGRSVYQFPVRSLSLSHAYDVQIPGQELNFLTNDNFLLSFKRGKNDKMWYNKKWQLEYLHETQEHLSFRVGLSIQQLTPAGVLILEKAATAGQQDPYLKTAEAFVEARWAPGETFYQGKRYRRPINNGHPVFTLRYTTGFHGSQEPAHNYHRVTGNVTKRFYCSQLGHTDVVCEGGAVFGTVPYPLLVIHRANQTYTYQLTSYNLMNFLEFMSDRYIGLNLQHSFNGFFFNKTPLLKKLGLREIISFKILSGTLNRQNDPLYNKSLYLLPRDVNAQPLTHSLQRGPYMEASAGVSNIFKILRVDWVQRLSYLEHPGISRWGIRARLQFDF